MMSFPVFALLLLQQNPDERFVYDGVVQGGSESDDGAVTRHCRLWTVHPLVSMVSRSDYLYVYGSDTTATKQKTFSNITHASYV